jgi:hypothetical protein
MTSTDVLIAVVIVGLIMIVGFVMWLLERRH